MMQRFALIEDGTVREIVEIPDDASIEDRFHSSLRFVAADADAAVGWIWNGNDLVAPVALPPALDDYRLAIQSHVDAVAQARNYDSGLTCASYVGSTNPTWATEASAFVAWRDAVWVHAYAELAKVEAAQRPQPTIEAFLSELPAMAWPE